MEYWEDYEVLEIETPELLTLHLPLAGFGPRALAFFLDSLLISLAQIVIGGLFILIGASLSVFQSMTGNIQLIVVTFIIFFLIVLLIYPLYFIVFESIWNGQTPGKRTTGIRVVQRGGLPLNMQAIVMRNLMRLVDMLPSNNFAGVISFFATSKQQRIGDLVADTVVIREFASDQPLSWIQAYGGQVGKAPDIGTVTPRIALAIGSYLQRANEFELELRHNLSGALVRALGYSPDTLSLSQRDSYLASVLGSYHARG
jgi:uncharacterized RDD family membrane protein YckC